MENKVVNPLLHNLLGFSFDQGAKLLHLTSFERWSSRLWQEFNTYDTAIDDTEFGPAFPALALAVDVNGLMLITVEEHIQP